MPVELTHPNGEEFHVSQPGWHAVLKLARRHGWEPAAARAEEMTRFSREEADDFARAVDAGLAEGLDPPQARAARDRRDDRGPGPPLRLLRPQRRPLASARRLLPPRRL